MTETRTSAARVQKKGWRPRLEARNLNGFRTRLGGRRRDEGTMSQRTPQEIQIAMILARGKTAREAATQLFLSPKTIEYHLRKAYRKLVSDRAMC